MRYVIGRIWARPGQRAEYLRLTAGYNEKVRAEQGCLYYDQGPIDGDPDGIILVECWESIEAHAAHAAQPYREATVEIFGKHVLRAQFDEMDVSGVKPIVVDLSGK